MRFAMTGWVSKKYLLQLRLLLAGVALTIQRGCILKTWMTRVAYIMYALDIHIGHKSEIYKVYH